MPTPPLFWTSRLLAVRSTTPRSHTTTLPATLAGSSVPGPQRFGVGRTCRCSVRGNNRRLVRDLGFHDGGSAVQGSVRNLDGSEQVAGECGGRHRGQPRRRVVDRGGTGPGVAGRGGDKHAGGGGVKEGQCHGIRGAVRVARDGVVQDIDAVFDGGVDRFHRGGGVAAAGSRIVILPADLVDRNLGSGCHAGALAEALAVEYLLYVGVAGGRGGRVRAVAAHIDRGDQFLGGAVFRLHELQEGVREVAGAEDFGIAQSSRQRRRRCPHPSGIRLGTWCRRP